LIVAARLLVVWLLLLVFLGFVESVYNHSLVYTARLKRPFYAFGRTKDL
jgi:hypothetical protein